MKRKLSERALDRWTIYDVAREAGVSAKTVSRVLNGKGGVGCETRARILEIMQRVDFHPHIGARGLRGKKNACIGVTLPAPMDEIPVSQDFFLYLFYHLYRVFGVRGEYVCFDVNPYDASSGRDYARGIFEQLFKACVVAGPLAVDDTNIHRIHRSGIPYLALGRLDSLPECSSATVDYVEGAYLSTKILLERGHTRIALLKGFHGYQPGEERIRGYRMALDEAGIPFDEALIRAVNFGSLNAANMVYRLLADAGVTGLIDSSAVQDSVSLREGLRRAGRTPGKNVEVVAWTYDENAAVLTEAAAHLWLPVREAAAEGIERLGDWVMGLRHEPIQVIYRPVVIHAMPSGELPKPKRLFELRE